MNLGAPLHVVAHDFGAWCVFSWALLFPNDFKSLTLIEAGIPGVTLLNEKQFGGKLPIRLLAVGGQYSIPTMGESLQPYFKDVRSIVIPDSGHFVPEEQPEALAKALLAFL